MSTTLPTPSFGAAMDAFDAVRSRMMRASVALEAAGIIHAVVGGNAVASWISTVNRAAISFTQDVDVLVRRDDFSSIRQALEAAGFVYRHLRGVDVFLDGVDGRPRNAVHLVFANEVVRDGEPASNPDPSQFVRGDLGQRVLDLSGLVQIKLTAFRPKDREHVCDFLDLGLIDATWLDHLPPALAARLKQLIDNPE